MPPPSAQDELSQLRTEEYRARLDVKRLRREAYDEPGRPPTDELAQRLKAAEQILREAEKARIAAQAKDGKGGLILDTRRQDDNFLGAKTTGLEAELHLRMAQLPTSISHLLDRVDHPLVSCRVKNVRDEKPRRVRVTSFIDGYSACAVDTVELEPRQEFSFDQLPTLFPDRLRMVTELTRATLDVLVEDLDTEKVELHKTAPIWLLAQTTAVLAVTDPKTGDQLDFSPYLGAFVTPNALPVMAFLSHVRSHHPARSLEGYQREDEPGNVEAQVKAVFDALKAEGRIGYVNSIVDFSPEEGSSNQRVRLPEESLANCAANCLDGVVLFASLLEAISLSPAIVVIPGHALVAWETGKESDEWRYLETTMLETQEFNEACAEGARKAEEWKPLAVATNDDSYFRLHPLRELRSIRRIFPMR